MTVKEVKQIDDCKLRSMCIRNNWYTKGTSAEYSAMFAKCDVENVTPEILYMIAEDIYWHTDLYDHLVSGCYPDFADEENILNIMIYLNDCCIVYFELGE